MPLRDGEQLIVDPLGLVVTARQGETRLLDDQGLAQVTLLPQVPKDCRGFVRDSLRSNAIEPVEPVPTLILQHPGEKDGQNQCSRDGDRRLMGSPRGRGLAGVVASRLQPSLRPVRLRRGAGPRQPGADTPIAQRRHCRWSLRKSRRPRQRADGAC